MALRGHQVILLMGPNGAGKGTQAEKLARARSLRKLSTGDILRDHVRRQSELGVQAKSVMDAGQLVSDELMVAMVRAELAEQEEVRVLFDGFPRTTAQADALDALLREVGANITAVVLLEVDEEELIRRLAKRAAAEGRSDDAAEVARERLRVYSQQTAPLIDYYARRGQLRRVGGSGSVEEVFARISEVLP